MISDLLYIPWIMAVRHEPQTHVERRKRSKGCLRASSHYHKVSICICFCGQGCPTYASSGRPLRFQKSKSGIMQMGVSTECDWSPFTQNISKAVAGKLCRVLQLQPHMQQSRKSKQSRPPLVCARVLGRTGDVD